VARHFEHRVEHRRAADVACPQLVLYHTAALGICGDVKALHPGASQDGDGYASRREYDGEHGAHSTVHRGPFIEH
jgi:hypothetical protein